MREKRQAPGSSNRYTTSTACAVMPIEFVPSPTVVYRSASTFPPTQQISGERALAY